MLPLNIKNSLNIVYEELKNIENRREHLIKESRELIILCSQTIIEVHQNNLEASQSKLEKAKALYFSLKDYAKQDLSRYLSISEQELVEASIVLGIAKNKSFPSLVEMNVSSQSYLLGFLDSIGEIKRMIYDKVRLGNYKEAEILFIQMQEIFNAIYPFAVYDNFVSGIRKKLDVCRILIENTRELMTEESRRSILIQSLDKLNNNE
ncbi:MAG TPA: RNA-binding protein [Nitrososphaeraceae archaeon]|nr:RNA-binding protein [Nitrososphaeraceae archaeon]